MTIKNGIQRVLSGVTVLGLSISIISTSAFAQTISQDDANSVYNDTVWYKPTNSTSACTLNPGSPVSTNQNQTAIIKTIIGIAKSDNLDQTAAVIGLMTADAETGFKNDANSAVPVSLNLPHDGVGNNYDSVGVYQQRVASGWSTLAPAASQSIEQSQTASQAYANQFPKAVAQLMNVAYAAEAFFGSPYGSNAPSALSKGLQDISWRSLSPAEAAATVQHDQGGASVYASFQNDAESLVSQYWNSSPNVPLPETGTSSVAGGSNNSQCVSVGTGTYANPLRSVQQLRPRRIDQGVDYAGQGSVYALGDGIITNLVNSGWNFGGYDAFIGEQLSDGPAKGLYVYVAEACVPVSTLRIGDTVTPNTIICNMINPADTGIETGWAAPPGDGAALANGQYDGGATAYGVNYNQLLVSLGAPSGINETNSVTGSLPSNWPQW